MLDYENMLVPDITILPSQFRELFQPSDPTPEHKLVMAILKQAIIDFQGRAWISRGKHNLIAVRAEQLEYQRQAQDWFFCEEDSGPFSFENVCGFLGIDPQQARRNLQSLIIDSAAAPPVFPSEAEGSENVRHLDTIRNHDGFRNKVGGFRTRRPRHGDEMAGIASVA